MNVFRCGGYVHGRSAHAGFSGKASGIVHTEAKDEFTSLVERLIGEKSTHPAAST